MKDSDKENISDSIEDTPLRTKSDRNKFSGDLNPADLPKTDNKSYNEIAKTLRIDIPVCKSIPKNGRIYVIEVTGDEIRTTSGIILPQKLKEKKDDTLKNVQRYFVVAWDKDTIPESIQKDLCVGIEVHPLLPQEAEDWTLPKMIDWQTQNTFLLLHYTELAGVSAVKPQISLK